LIECLILVLKRGLLIVESAALVLHVQSLPCFGLQSDNLPLPFIWNSILSILAKVSIFRDITVLVILSGMSTSIIHRKLPLPQLSLLNGRPCLSSFSHPPLLPRSPHRSLGSSKLLRGDSISRSFVSGASGFGGGILCSLIRRVNLRSLVAALFRTRRSLGVALLLRDFSSQGKPGSDLLCIPS
jgi:hypothetical protein